MTTTMQVGTPLTQGTSFGELALMYNTARAATIKASSACKLWYIDRTLFRKIVTYFQLVRTERYVGFLGSVRFGEQTLAGMLSKNQLEQIAGALEQETFTEGEYIIRQGQEGDYFYIVEEGEVGIYKHEDSACNDEVDASTVTQPGPLAVLKPGAYFGEKALLAEDKRQASCIAESTVKCLTLARDDFVMMLGNLDDLIAGTRGDDAHGAPEAVAEEKPELPRNEDEVFSFDNLNVIQTLGCGAFGRVKLVQSTVDGKTYALKCQSKKVIVDNALQVEYLQVVCSLGARCLSARSALVIYD